MCDFPSKYRLDREPLLLESMKAHTGKCHYCDGPVKMPVMEAKLETQKCFCLFCGQRYYMEIPDINAWVVEQWEQKLNKD